MSGGTVRVGVEEGECACVFVCVCEREKARECVCVSACVCGNIHVCVCLCLYVYTLFLILCSLHVYAHNIYTESHKVIDGQLNQKEGQEGRGGAGTEGEGGQARRKRGGVGTGCVARRWRPCGLQMGVFPPATANARNSGMCACVQARVCVCVGQGKG